ncbi:ATP-binding protein [Pedobacter aquatilis]|uniref:SMP-30/gluconolactonase/LRE family protein n=1 Tax=Pedobacter aquatilis TaxID=351343 RepID=UPI00292DDC7D|nr:ATP-binding protein [Pedobacter aquatilis]
MKNILIVLFASIASLCNAQNPGLTKKWEANQNLTTPESVLYQAKNKMLYVSLIDGEAAKKDGKGGIALLNIDGSIKKADWVTGLDAPKGLGIFKDKLYVADIDKVIAINTSTGKIISKVTIEGAVFLNDITIDGNGNVYVSDTRTGKIYQIKNGKATLYMENVSSPNGLKYYKNELYVLAGTQLVKFNAKKEKTVIATGLEKSGDGLEILNDGSFIASCWSGIIYHITKDGTKTKLLDVQGKMNTADIGIDLKNNIIYVPTFNANSVIAYELKK